MVGKLDLADGDNYGGYWRRAKAVAEVRDYVQRNGVLALGGGLSDPVLAGSVVTLTLTTGTARDFVAEPLADTPRDTILDDLAALASNDPEIIAAGRLEDNIALIPVRLVTINSAVLDETPPPPPP